MQRETIEQDRNADDCALLGRIREGDEQAMVLLFDRHASVVYAVALRVLSDPSGAEDVMQEVFLRIWRKPPAVETASLTGTLAGWFAVLARNRAIDLLRRKRPSESTEDVVLLSPVNVESESEHNLLLQRARTLIGALPEEQQTVLQLAYFDGLSHTEIAERLQSPLGTIKTRLRRAVLTLRKAAQA
ncbi:RNA polymerase sigma factor [Acidipila sp. EB88]|uniref:RNA polymerase sigma factor n=1 Tax=Acidipila sp. EB88 TaxID=2305226 RepID=UPI000F60167C|nr:sigma-70 family RNA polymerase sigma factor [Acidipila sp. EB88]RRA47548.1 sigma-70 family RNA polymerase sigma factor [Acidipila sp. EB88]